MSLSDHLATWKSATAGSQNVKITPMNSKYNIMCDDTFDSYKYPLVEEEVVSISRATGHLPPLSKGEIIISYYKDHCLKVQWLKDHPELVRMITSRRFLATNLESLFDSCRTNKGFLETFEDHIKVSFSMKIASNIQIN